MHAGSWPFCSRPCREAPALLSPRGPQPQPHPGPLRSSPPRAPGAAASRPVPGTPDHTSVRVLWGGPWQLHLPDGSPHTRSCPPEAASPLLAWPVTGRQPVPWGCPRGLCWAGPPRPGGPGPRPRVRSAQSSRIDDQRCPPPDGLPRGPTMPDEDFFSLIQRVQAKRMDEQRVDLAGSPEQEVGGPPEPRQQCQPGTS